MGHMTKKVDGLFTIPIFQFSVRRTHPAHGLDFTAGTLGVPGNFFVADLRKEAFPSFLETSFAEIKSVTPRKNTNTQHSIRVDGKAVDTRSAVVQLIGLFRWMDRAVEFLGKALPFGHPLGVLKVQPDDFLGCEPKSERAVGSVDPGINHGVKPKLKTQVLFHKPFHFPDLVFVYADHHGLELQGEAMVLEQTDSPHTSLERAGNPGDPFVGFGGATIEGNFDHKGRHSGQEGGNLFRHQDAIGEEGDEQALSLGMGVNVQKILPG